jgi:hypothetical protein
MKREIDNLLLFPVGRTLAALLVCATLTSCDTGPESIKVGILHSFSGPLASSERAVAESSILEIVWQSDRPIRPNPYPASRKQTEWELFLNQLSESWGGAWSAPGP